MDPAPRCADSTDSRNFGQILGIHYNKHSTRNGDTSPTPDSHPRGIAIIFAQLGGMRLEGMLRSLQDCESTAMISSIGSYTKGANV